MPPDKNRSEVVSRRKLISKSLAAGGISVASFLASRLPAVTATNHLEQVSTSYLRFIDAQIVDNQSASEPEIQVQDLSGNYADLSRRNEAAPAYTIFIDDSKVKAKNGSNGHIDHWGTVGADDATVIQDAINALSSGGFIFIKAGTYSLSTALVDNGVDGIRIEGEGPSTILRTPNAANVKIFHLTSAKSWIIRNIRLDGNRANQTIIDVNDSLNLSGCDDCILEGLEVINGNSHAILINNSGIGNKVLGCKVTNSENCCVYVKDSADTIISGCTLSVPNDDQILRISYTCKNTVVVGNVLKTPITTSDAIMVYGTVASPNDGVIIDGNTIDGSEAQGARTVAGISVSGDSCRSVVISNNRIINCRRAIYGTAKDFIVANNKISACTEGMEISGEHHVIDGNLVEFCEEHGIWLNGGSPPNTHHTIQNNVCKNNGQTVAGGSGIVAYKSSYNLIQDNRCYDDQAVKTQAWGIQESTSTSDNNAIKDNDVRENNRGGISFVGVNTIVKDNVGYNPQPVAAIRVGVSPYAYRNTDGYPEEVIVSGGTVSDTSFSRDGRTYYTTGVTAGKFHLEPTEYLRITYSVTPTVTKVPM